jgi:ketosteroid isomerase-like protein
MIKAIICALMLVPMISTGSFAQSKEESAVAAAVDALRKAMIDPDKNVLDKLLSDDLSYGHSSGQIQSKAELIESLTGGKSDFMTIELSEQTLKVVDKTAIVRHHFIATTNDGGKTAEVRLAVLLVWVKQKGDWKLLARQAVKVQK